MPKLGGSTLHVILPYICDSYNEQGMSKSKVFEIIMTTIFLLEFGARWYVCDSLGTMTKGLQVVSASHYFWKFFAKF